MSWAIGVFWKPIFTTQRYFESALPTVSPLNLMLWVSVSPGRDRACRHGRIAFLLEPLGKAATIVLIFV